jgi:predicted site-specific integrase-resolvase
MQAAIRFARSPTGQRRFYLADIKRITPRDLKVDERITINYARVSSHDQKEDLHRQSTVLELFSAANGWQFETIDELSFEQELVQDMIDLIQVFNARLYGARSHKSQKLIDGIAKAVEDVK